MVSQYNIGNMGKGSNIWDDPEWESLRRRVNKQPQLPKEPKTSKHKHSVQKPPVQPENPSETPKKVEVSVNVTLPKLSLPKIPKLKRKHIILGVSVVASLITIILAVKIISGIRAKNDAPNSADTQQEKPPFDTLTPNGKDQNEVGPLVKISPTGNDPVYAYVDKIGGTQIRVSQQKLPQKLQTNTDEEVKTLAENFGATRLIKGANPKAYIGIDVSGAQSVVLHKNDLLILMNSTKELEDYQWAEYIIRLE